MCGSAMQNKNEKYVINITRDWGRRKGPAMT